MTGRGPLHREGKVTKLPEVVICYVKKLMKGLQQRVFFHSQSIIPNGPGTGSRVGPSQSPDCTAPSRPVMGLGTENGCPGSTFDGCSATNSSFPIQWDWRAWFDKNADVYPALSALGFGSVEVGTLTPKPQPGNPRPRLYRLPEDEAVINRMGFNNGGIIRASTSLATLPRPGVPVGINLERTGKDSGREAAGDYRTGLRALYRYGDYFVINISSPNTQGLRDLQQADSLSKLLSVLIEEREELREETGEIRPLFVKLAPDLSRDELSEAVRIGLEQGIDGFIAVNTTLAREGLKSPHRMESGGLSGRPLHHRSIQWIPTDPPSE